MTPLAPPPRSRAARQEASAGPKGWDSKSLRAVRVAAEGGSPCLHPERLGGHPPRAARQGASATPGRWRGQRAGGAPLCFMPCCFARRENVRRGQEGSSCASGHTHFS